MRLFAELADEAAAGSFVNMVLARVTTLGKISWSEAKRYWKIAGWFEVSIVLRPKTKSGEIFARILSSLGRGWHQHEISSEERWAIWKPEPGNSFFSPHVRWAHVERLPESTVVSQ